MTRPGATITSPTLVAGKVETVTLLVQRSVLSRRLDAVRE